MKRIVMLDNPFYHRPFTFDKTLYCPCFYLCLTRIATSISAQLKYFRAFKTTSVSFVRSLFCYSGFMGVLAAKINQMVRINLNITLVENYSSFQRVIFIQESHVQLVWLSRAALYLSYHLTKGSVSHAMPLSKI